MPMGNVTEKQHPMHPDTDQPHTIIYGKEVSQAKYDAWDAVKAGWRNSLQFPSDEAAYKREYDTFSAEWTKTHPGE